MKYRVKIDESFEEESDARDLYNYALKLMSKAVSVNEGLANEELSLCDLVLCGHDEGRPCQKMERVMLIDKKIVTMG